MWSLMRKEWRDYRALMYGFLVLPPLVSLGLRWFVIGWPKVSHTESVQYIVPGFFALFVVAVAADLIAGDTGSGRIRFLAALPVRPTTVWLTKVLFLASTATIFLGYLVSAEWILLGIAGKDVSQFFPDLARSVPLYAAITTGGAAVLMGSTLLDRSLSAVLAGTAALAAVAALVLIYDPTRFGLRYRVTMLLPVALTLTAAFLLASYLAFARGRVHLGARLRRLVLAAAGFLLVATAPAVVSARAIEAWWNIAPSDTSARWSISPLAGVTPDGRWLLASAHRAGRGPFGVWPHRGGLFAVRLEDGAVRDLTGVGMRLGGASKEWYPARDRLRLARIERNASPRGQVVLTVDYDLDLGRATRTRVDPRPPDLYCDRLPLGPWILERRNRREFVERPDGEAMLPDGWNARSIVAPWGIGVYQRRRKGEKQAGHFNGVFHFGTGRVRALEGTPLLLPARPDGDVLILAKDGCGIRAVPLGGGPSRPVLEARYRTSSTSPDGSRLVVATASGLYRFRSDRIEPEALGGPPELVAVDAIRWSQDSCSFLAVAGGEAHRGTRDGTILTTFGDLGDARPVWFDGDRVVAHDRGANQIIAVDCRGTRRLLPTPE